MVRIDDDVYERIAAHKREEETFSEAIERLLASPSLLSLTGILEDQAEAFEAAVETADADFETELDGVVDEFE